MLILGWLLLGLAFLAIEAGSLSLSAGGGGNGKYATPITALQWNLMPQGSPIPWSQFPWGAVSLQSIFHL